LHKLVEDAGRGRLSGANADGAVRARFEALLRESQKKVSEDTSSNAFADLKKCFSFVEWHSRTEIAIAEATLILEKRQPRRSVHPLKEDRGIDLTGLKDLFGCTGEFTFFEVPFLSRGLRLKGRIDEIARKQPGGTIEVIDYKTGRILDDDGTLSSRIVFQVRLYGLAVLECLPHVVVQPYVRSGEEYHAIPFDPEDIRQTENDHRALLARLSPGQSHHADSLAELGPHCRTCQIRHVCPRYRTEAVPLWIKPIANFSLALDICGSIVKREKSDDGTSTLTLRDPADRLIKIHRLCLPDDQIRELMQFRRVWFFNLCSHEGGLKGGAWHHPRNFYQLPARHGEPRAWSMEAFGINDDDPDW
jgi:hypothetical protein